MNLDRWQRTFAEQPDWAKALEILYEHENRTSPAPFDSGTLSPEIGMAIMNETNLDEQAAKEALWYLRDMGLVEIQIEFDELAETTFTKGGEEIELEDIESIEQTPVAFGGLTQDGFRVAHNRKLERQQQTTNQLVLGLTAVLVIFELWTLFL